MKFFLYIFLILFYYFFFSIFVTTEELSSAIMKWHHFVVLGTPWTILIQYSFQVGQSCINKAGGCSGPWCHRVPATIIMALPHPVCFTLVLLYTARWGDGYFLLDILRWLRFFKHIMQLLQFPCLFQDQKLVFFLHHIMRIVEWN